MATPQYSRVDNPPIDYRGASILQATFENQATSTLAAERKDFLPDVRSIDKDSVNDASSWSRLSSFSDRFWLAELSSLLLSFIFLIAIIIVLKLCNGKPLPDWGAGPFSVTVNFLVSILSMLNRVFLLSSVSQAISQLKWIWFRSPRALVDVKTFDEASRGSLGALQLLRKLRCLHLASLGSIIVIAALAVSPFVQKVITYETYERPLPLNATVPRSNSYFLAGSGDHLNPPASLSTKASVYAGIFNTDETSFEVKPDCMSGNCTFPPYASIAVCSKCTNITSYVSKSVYRTSPSADNNGTITYEEAYNYSLPNGLFIYEGGGIYINTTATNGGYEDQVWSVFSSKSFKGSAFTYATVISSTNDAIEAAEYGPGLLGPWAGQCALYQCVKVYNSTITNGILAESDVEITTYSDISALNLAGAYVGGGYALRPDPCPQNHVAHNYTAGLQGILTARFNLTECDYGMSRLSVQAITNWMSSAFTMRAQGSIPDFNTAIYNNGNSTFEAFEAVMQRIAKSMTSEFRTNGATGGPALGIASVPETHIIIRWEWLALPVALNLLAVVVVIGTIWKSKGFVLWKSSALALMFHSPFRAEEQWVAVEQLHQMEKVAEEKVVTLRKGYDHNFGFHI